MVLFLGWFGITCGRGLLYALMSGVLGHRTGSLLHVRNCPLPNVYIATHFMKIEISVISFPAIMVIAILELVITPCSI